METTLTSSDLPSYGDLILPVLRAVQTAGGSAASQEIEQGVLAAENPSEEVLGVMHANRPDVSVYIDRLAWARSYAKLIGALESPRRGMFILTKRGRELLALPEEEGREEVRRLDREFRRNRRRAKLPETPMEVEDPGGEDPVTRVDGSEPEGLSWRELIWQRLHEFTPEEFEEFVLYVLREYGMQLERVGGTGDEGIDGIGTARLTPILSSRVAVQIKRYDPHGRAVGREVVALLQRDAAYVGAERAVLVTLGRFSEQARRAAIATTPTVELIDGRQLTDLMLEKSIAVKLQPVVDESWFDLFRSGQEAN